MQIEPPYTERDIFRAWLPLWISWFVMALEIPVVTGAIARLPDPATNLAALGGILIPLSFIIEAPVLMLLSASTAPCRDRSAYRFLFRVMVTLGLTFAGLHALVATTPLYDFITRDVLGCPSSVREAARLGLIILIPWTGAIAFRRFYQGILIRYGRTRLVGFGTVIRLLSNITTIGACFVMGGMGGALTGACAMSAGVVAEAIFIGVAARGVVRERLPLRDAGTPELTVPRFAEFYLPLVVTAFLDFLIQPLASGALTRMPAAIDSLALWPVIGGLMFLLRGPAFALNEVVIASLARHEDNTVVRRFTWRLVGLSLCIGLGFVATPFGGWWFERVVRLPVELVDTARMVMWLALPALVAAPFKSLFAATLVHRRRTRGISIGTLVSVASFGTVVGLSIAFPPPAGIYAVVGAMSVAALGQVLWLRCAVARGERARL